MKFLILQLSPATDCTYGFDIILGSNNDFSLKYPLSHGAEPFWRSRPALYGTLRFITVFTRALYWSLS
jgi:hypothetical protein